ncbi:hypothetical protein Tsubulata_002640, partial [Turnera subulata]
GRAGHIWTLRMRGRVSICKQQRHIMKLMGADSTVIIIAIIILVVSPSCSSSSSSSSQTTTFHGEYGAPFNSSYYNIFAVQSPATISNGALQVTPDSANDNFTLADRSGRIFLNKSFQMWELNNNNNNNDQTAGEAVRIASFNTTFLVNIFPLNTSLPGEGFAFLISPDLDIPLNSDGQYLGLTNSSTDNRPDNGIVAVELDTVKQGFDPDDNHLGLDLHSVNSTLTANLSSLGIQIAPPGGKNHRLWVHYSGPAKTLQVYMADEDKPKPAAPALSALLDLSKHVKQRSYFGFAASTGRRFQLNCVLGWSLTVEMLSEEEGEQGSSNNNNSNKKKIGVGVGVGLGAAVIVIVVMGYYMHRTRKKGASDPNLLGALKSLPGTPREFVFGDLKKATNNFDDKHNKLGQGGFGMVYKGVLPKENVPIAVKKFSRDNIKGQDDFLAELTIINRLRHKHLVRLLGWCHKNGMLLLVYDLMPNGSLDKHLFHGEEERSRLEWGLRYKIISGVASALHYLHNEYDQKVVHRDLKASNIMLDAEFNARLGDFGLARALENEKTSYAELEGVPGTMGYIAPECFHTGKATCESDVYGFGAVVLEVVCGQRPWTKIEGFQFLVDWVWCLHREGRLLEAVDQRLANDYAAEEAQRLLLLGLACSHPSPRERPKTQTIFQIISGSVPVPYVPPFKPAFVWPSATNSINIDLSTADTTPITSGWTPQPISPDSCGAERYTDSSLV